MCLIVYLSARLLMWFVCLFVYVFKLCVFVRLTILVVCSLCLFVCLVGCVFGCLPPLIDCLSSV